MTRIPIVSPLAAAGITALTHRLPVDAEPPETILAIAEDHRRILYLFGLWNAARDDARRLVLLREIASEITLQARVARELLFPAIEPAMGQHALMLRRILVDHGSLLGLLTLFDAMDVMLPAFPAYVTVLEQHVRERVRDEEQELFPRLRNLAIDLDALGDQLRQFRSQLLFQATAVATPGGPQPAVPKESVLPPLVA